MGEIEHFNKLEDQIFTLDKIITYKVASALLNTKPELIQKILKKFIQKYQNDPLKKLHVTFLLGITNSDGSKKIIVVNENDYEKVKGTSKDTFIDQIYSIQKSKVVSWESIFNLDDLLNCDIKHESSNSTAKVVTVTVTEPKKATEKNVSPKKNVPKNTSNPINLLFNQQKMDSKSGSKQEQPKKSIVQPSKPKNDIKNMFGNIKPKEKKVDQSKSEDVKSENLNGVNKKSSFSKKRNRIIDDDDEEEENVSKHMKAELFDSDTENESEKENKISDDEGSDNDIFNTNITEEMEVEESLEKTEKESVESQTKTDSSQNQSQSKNGSYESDSEDQIKEKEKPKEPAQVMFEDDDGFFVTEKKTTKKATPKETKAAKVENKKALEEQEKKEKQARKETNEKLKKNTNQKTLLNFFKKV